MRTGKGFYTRLGFFRLSDWLEISEESHVCTVAHSYCKSYGLKPLLQVNILQLLYQKNCNHYIINYYGYSITTTC